MVAELCVELDKPVDQVGNLVYVSGFVVEATEDVGIGKALEDLEAPAKRYVNRTNAAIRGVHRPDNQELARNEPVLRVLAVKRAVSAPVLERIHQLAEHARTICPVHLVDDQDLPVGSSTH